MKTGLAIYIIALLFNPLYGQIKYEKESRLKTRDVPKKASDYVEKIAGVEKVKWYHEEGYNRSSIEAKFKINKEKYSVEFDTNGLLEDVEIEITWIELDPSIKDSIKSALSQDCDKYKIRKMQVQYSGNENFIPISSNSKNSTEDYLVRYEIVLKCCNVSDIKLLEYLFDDRGQKLSVSQIVFKNSSHLEY